MIKFNLEKALNGARVITRDGREVTQLTLFEISGNNTLYCVIDNSVLSFSKNGKYWSSGISDNDLFIAPEMLSGFVNLYSKPYKNAIWHQTKKEADAGAMNKRIACIDLSQFPVGYGLEDE